MGAALGKEEEQLDWVPATKLEAKIVEAMRNRAANGTTVKSLNTVILKFPKIEEGFGKCRTTFEEFDADKNGVIDQEELKNSFHKLEVSLTEEEFNDLFNACDFNEDKGISFNEFIVLLSLVYLLKTDLASREDEPYKPAAGMPNLDSIFETLVEAFVFLDKNKDGHVTKSEMAQAINETTTGERSSGRIAMRRFAEMDWDNNGMVNFTEFLFTFNRWVRMDEADEDEYDDKEEEYYDDVDDDDDDDDDEEDDDED